MCVFYFQHGNYKQFRNIYQLVSISSLFIYLFIFTFFQESGCTQSIPFYPEIAFSSRNSDMEGKIP